MNDFYRKKTEQRTIFIAFSFLLWFGLLALRLFELQVVHYRRMRAEVMEQNQYQQDILPKRGTIYDRRGKILARSLPMPSCFLTPSKIEPPSETIAKLHRVAKILDLPPKKIQEIETRIRNRESFIWVKRKVEPQQAEEVKALGLNGVFFIEENKRVYPQGTLAAHILGGVGIDDEGLNGVELKYNFLLQGKKGKCLIWRDAKKREYHLEILKEAEAGKDLHLTIDETIQYIAERELRKAVESHQANWGTVIVSSPYTGEILALANYPTYDPNFYPPPRELEINRAIQHNFEPGSTFKIVTAAAAREKNAVSFAETFDCRKGAFYIDGKSIRDHKLFGILSFPEVIIHSSNVGMIQVSLQVGQNSLFEMIKAFRFGEKTGIDLPGEERGILRPFHTWTKFTLPSLSIGYEISVTAIQMLQALNIIATRGLLILPRVTMENIDSERNRPPQRVISERAAAELVSILEGVVQTGTGQAAQVPGFHAAGKTGTAQKLDPLLGGYSSSKHLASFAGFVPSSKPAISIMVVIDEPKSGLHYGGQVAAPLFREIAKRTLLYLKIPFQMPIPQPILTAHLKRQVSP